MDKVKTPRQQMQDNLIVKHLAGSYAYGTNIETSDVDYRGIFVADPIYVRTPFYTVHEVSDETEEDTKIYELGQFVKLAADCNPNILDTLWCDESSITFSTPEYQMLRDAAPQLLSAKAAYTFSGYAISQLKRIKNHNKWIAQQDRAVEKITKGYIEAWLSDDALHELFEDFIVEPLAYLKSEGKIQRTVWTHGVERINDLLRDPDVNLVCKKPPRQIHYLGEVFCLDRDKNAKFDAYQYFEGYRLIPYSSAEDGNVFGLYKAPGYTLANRDTFALNFDYSDKPDDLSAPIFIVKYNKQLYNDHKDRWEKYHQWKANRNKTRSVLEEQFGYDTKHGSHLIRLLHMGKEILEEGVVKVYRPDAQLLKDIRAGAWTYEEIVSYAEELDTKIRNELRPKTKLRSKPDLQFAAELVMKIQDSVWNK